MSKELEALENIECNCELYDFKYEDFERIRKALKALEIIKEKRVNIYLLVPVKRLTDYNKNQYIINELTQEEFDLLKEVFEWNTKN